MTRLHFPASDAACLRAALDLAPLEHVRHMFSRTGFTEAARPYAEHVRTPRIGGR